MRTVFFYSLSVAIAMGLTVTAPAPSLAAKAAEAEPTGRSATIAMTVPTDAQISFDGHETSATGTVRRFESPPLAPGKQYHYYNVRVQGTANGKKFDETICICVREGDQITISYPGGVESRQSFYAGAESPPARAKSYSFGPDSGGKTITYRTDYSPPPAPVTRWRPSPSDPFYNEQQ